MTDFDNLRSMWAKNGWVWLVVVVMTVNKIAQELIMVVNHGST